MPSCGSRRPTAPSPGAPSRAPDVAPVAVLADAPRLELRRVRPSTCAARRPPGGITSGRTRPSSGTQQRRRHPVRDQRARRQQHDHVRPPAVVSALPGDEQAGIRSQVHLTRGGRHPHVTRALDRRGLRRRPGGRGARRVVGVGAHLDDGSRTRGRMCCGTDRPRDADAADLRTVECTGSVSVPDRSSLTPAPHLACRCDDERPRHRRGRCRAGAAPRSRACCRDRGELDVASLSERDEPWVREDGGWRDDDC